MVRQRQCHNYFFDRLYQCRNIDIRFARIGLFVRWRVACRNHSFPSIQPCGPLAEPYGHLPLVCTFSPYRTLAVPDTHTWVHSLALEYAFRTGLLVFVYPRVHSSATIHESWCRTARELFGCSFSSVYIRYMSMCLQQIECIYILYIPSIEPSVAFWQRQQIEWGDCLRAEWFDKTYQIRRESHWIMSFGSMIFSHFSYRPYNNNIYACRFCWIVAFCMRSPTASHRISPTI